MAARPAPTTDMGGEMSQISRLLLPSAIVAAALGPGLGQADEMFPGDAIVMYDDLEWVPMMEGSPAEITILWGDPAVGPVGLLIRIPPGFEAPMHWHTSNYHAVVVQGTHQHWIDGEDRAAAADLGPGSYFRQVNKEVHADANVGADQVIAFVYFDGPVDEIMKE